MADKIEMGKTYRTRDGREVIIHSIDMRNIDHPIIGVFDDGCASTWTKYGKWVIGKDDPLDLIEVAADTPLDAHAVEDLVSQYNVARAAKDFATIASIRINLTSQGIVLNDTPCGITWDRVEMEDEAPDPGPDHWPITGIDDTLDQRETTHGDFADVASMAQGIKELIRTGKNWETMTASQRESLDMNASKQARIVCGNPNEPDHWHDIEGYARLVSKELAPEDAARISFKVEVLTGEKKLVRKDYVRAK